MGWYFQNSNLLRIGISRYRLVLLAAAEHYNFKCNIRLVPFIRLEKLDRGEYGALILAEAGLQRLGLEHRITRRFSPAEIVPAAGQGILAVQGRAGEYTDLLQRLNDPQAAFCAKIERAVSKALNGDCTAPIGAYADLQGENVTLYGFYAEDGIGIKSTLTGSVTQAESLANTFAEQLKQQVQEKKEAML